MAKISANGATEVAKLKVRSQAGYEYLYVMTSDGRVLRRATGDAGTGYSVQARKISPAKRTAEVLTQLVGMLGYTVIPS